MRARALAAAVALGLVAAVCFVMCGAEDAAAGGGESTASTSTQAEAIGATASIRHLQQELDWLQAQSPCDPALSGRAARSPPISREVLGMYFMGAASLVRSLQSLTDGGL